MVAGRVVSEEQLFDRLKKLGYARTTVTTGTGAFWKSKKGGHLLVPHSVQGFYPDWLLGELEERIGKINPYDWPLNRGE